jgi:hypothetical protein
MTDKEVNQPNHCLGSSNKVSEIAKPEQMALPMAQWLREFYRQTPALPDDFLADRLEKKTQAGGS